jgi:hypothetical protein
MHMVVQKAWSFIRVLLVKCLVTGTSVSLVFLFFFIFRVVQRLYSGLHPFIVEVSRSPTDTTHSVKFLWTRDLTIAETCAWQHWQTRETDIHTNGRIRTRNPPIERPSSPALDGEATGIGTFTSPQTNAKETSSYIHTYLIIIGAHTR